jgi:sulfur relay (sulfurtransferase) complex TusBCD TusD component (DsrE family)
MKVFGVFGLAFVAVMLLSSVALAAAYDVANLSNSNLREWTPQINNSGQVVWVGWDGTDSEIFLYQDGVISQLTINSTPDWGPQINDAGQVVWEAFDYANGSQIFLYHDGAVDRLTTNRTPNWFPQINNSGHVVWEGWDGTDSEIFLYDDGVVTQLTTNGTSDLYPHISDTGQVVWQGLYGIDSEIFLYQYGVISRLTNNRFWDEHPQINRSSQIVWMGWGYEDPDYEIFHYQDGFVSRLTTNDIQEYDPRINNSGQVLWWGEDGLDYGIFFYWDGVVSQVWNDRLGDGKSRPQINNGGQVVWQGGDGTDSEIFLYQDGVINQLTMNGTLDWFPQINDTGQVVWVGWDGDYLGDYDTLGDPDIYLATPIPNIEVSPGEIHFGNVAVGQSPTSALTVRNTGSSDLVASSLSLVSGGTTGLSILSSPGLPGTIAAGASVEVTLEFAPIAEGLITETLGIVSNDPDSPLVHVAINGNGVLADLPPIQQIADLLAFYDQSIVYGLLYGVGSGNSALKREKAFRNMIVAAKNYISEGNNATAVEQLRDILAHCDGTEQADQFVDGSNLARFAEKVQVLIASLQAEL